MTAAKIPSTCRGCERPLRRDEMEDYLDRLTRRGVDVEAHFAERDGKGILCPACVLGLLLLGDDEGESTAEPPITVATPTVCASCSDVVEVCRGRVVAQVTGDDALASQVAAVKARLVQAMRYDRADEVEELRAELATLRAEVSRG